MSDHLYPTLVADGSLSTHVADNRGMLQNQITSEVDKYLQEVAERHERDVNYFNGQHVATNTSSQQQKADFVEHDEEKVPESNGQDTGKNGAQNVEHDIQYYDKLETIPKEEEEEEDEEPQMAAKQDVDNLDMIAYNPEESEENHLIWPSITPLKTQLLSWANQSPPHSSQMKYASQLRR